MNELLGENDLTFGHAITKFGDFMRIIHNTVILRWFTSRANEDITHLGRDPSMIFTVVQQCWCFCSFSLCHNVTNRSESIDRLDNECPYDWRILFVYIEISNASRRSQTRTRWPTDRRVGRVTRASNVYSNIVAVLNQSEEEERYITSLLSMFNEWIAHHRCAITGECWTIRHAHADRISEERIHF